MESIKMEGRASALGGCTGPLNEQVSGRWVPLRSSTSRKPVKPNHTLEQSGEALGLDMAVNMLMYLTGAETNIPTEPPASAHV